MFTKKFFLTVLAVGLVLITSPLYLTISGLSIMALDSGEAAWQPWVFILTVWGISLLVLVGSLVGSVKLIRKGLSGKGILVSLIPALVMSVFWLWLSTQSFS